MHYNFTITFYSDLKIKRNNRLVDNILKEKIEQGGGSTFIGYKLEIHWECDVKYSGEAVKRISQFLI